MSCQVLVQLFYFVISCQISLRSDCVPRPNARLVTPALRVLCLSWFLNPLVGKASLSFGEEPLFLRGVNLNQGLQRRGVWISLSLQLHASSPGSAAQFLKSTFRGSGRGVFGFSR